MRASRCLQFILASVPVFAAALAQEGNVGGKVIDRKTKEPIPMVNIFVRGNSINTTTDSLGVFSLSLSGEKNFVVSFSHIGYFKRSYDLQVREKDGVTLTVELEPRAIELSGVTVTASRRPEDIFARVITEKDIEQSAPHTMSDLLRSWHPLVFNSTGWGRGPESILFPRSTPAFRVFWNGSEIDPNDLDTIDPYTSEKILIWQSMEAPIRYITTPRQFMPRGSADRITPKKPTSANSLPPYVIEIRTK